MIPFDDSSTAGNERAFRRGPRVPDEAVNLAWVKAPKLSPEKNVVIIDTSNMVTENIIAGTFQRKVMFSNYLGILEDEHGNQIIEDEYPFVTDTFSIDEDFSVVPGNEYRNKHVLPFLHTSRYFHIDHAGLTLGTIPQTYRDNVLRIVDESGREYVNDDGTPRYRIQITPARLQVDPSSTQGAYRVWAFVDDYDNESLYLAYNKIEISADGQLINQNINHKELLNPAPFFQYRPEETDVIDPSNRHLKIYSTKPVIEKQQEIGVPYSEVDGYKVFVPRKAIGDPRLFQLFRWRVACDFTEQYKIDPTRDQSRVNAGVVVTNKTPDSYAKYAFYNLELSQYNVSGVQFTNPLYETTPTTAPAKNTAAYWQVNFDTVSYTDLAKFDILIWCPPANTDFGPFLTKIRYFTETLGKTLLIDFANKSTPTNLGVTASMPVRPTSGLGVYGTAANKVVGSTILSANISHPIFDANSTLGGWTFNDGSNDEYNSITPLKNGAFGAYGYSHYLSAHAGYTALLTATDINGAAQTVMAQMALGSGNIFVSTIGTAAFVSSLFSDVNGTLVAENNGAIASSTVNYQEYINSYSVEGLYKLLYNISLYSLRGITLDSTDEQRFSSNWTFASKWRASWVIDGTVLTEHERATNDFVYAPKDPTDTVPVWQRKLSDKNMKALLEEGMTAEDLRRVAGAARVYRIEVTNNLVDTTITLDANTRPYAWTEAYSPPFNVPVELGPHAVKEDQIQGEYNAGQYTYRNYPPKPYAVQVGVNYTNSSQSLVRKDTTVTATGSALRIGTTTTPIVSTQTELTWASHTNKGMVESGYPFEYGMWRPDDLNTWQQSNYYTGAWGPGNKNWPFFVGERRLRYGTSDSYVMFIQEAFNRFYFFQMFDTGVGYLAVDGYFGNKTRTAVLNFQATFGAQVQDGEVDAETYSIIFAQIIRGGFLLGHGSIYDHTWAFLAVLRDGRPQFMSDGDPFTRYRKKSNTVGGPSIIWEMFGMRFHGGPYNIHGVTMIPAVEYGHDYGFAPHNQMWRSIHIFNSSSGHDMRAQMVNYNSQWGQAIYMPYRPWDGQRFYVPIGPYSGNSVIVGVGQDQPMGAGTARMLGIRELIAHAITQTGGQTIYTKTPTTLTFSRTITVTTGFDVTLQAVPQNQAGQTLAHIAWTGVTSSNADVSATITPTGVITLRHNEVDINATDAFTFGPALPRPSGSGPYVSSTYYSMNENRVMNPGSETGWISKTEGIKLLCDANGNPYGFPPLPTGVGPSEAQRHYATVSISRLGTDASVTVGFYDINQREFIVNRDGLPEMSFIEYLSRGPQNIYVGLISTFEEAIPRALPPADDAPPIPYRWAMPVYGVAQRVGTHIGIDPLPKDLGVTDMWALPIRTGKFIRSVKIRPRSAGPIAGWLGKYQGRILKAFYAVPEAERYGWSLIYGRPNVDIEDETPLLETSNIVKVKYPPLHMVQEPTAFNEDADPVRPAMRISTRESVAASWEELPLSELIDYNASTGEIFLKNSLASEDPNLVKITYTTPTKVYSFKQYEGQKLNLNPYIGIGRELIGKPIYVYIVPEFVKDTKGRIIAESTTDTTVRFSLEDDIFDAMSPTYDPLAVQLGVVYITNGLDIKDLVILDTRRRGGGAKDSMALNELTRLVQESIGYWDVGHGAGTPYPAGGYVIIRLPAELKEDLSESEVLEVINRNITAGVAFKLQDLEGNNW